MKVSKRRGVRGSAQKRSKIDQNMIFSINSGKCAFYISYVSRISILSVLSCFPAYFWLRLETISSKYITKSKHYSCFYLRGDPQHPAYITCWWDRRRHGPVRSKSIILKSYRNTFKPLHQYRKYLDTSQCHGSCPIY